MNTSKPEPMTEESLRALVDTEMRNSVGYASGKMAAMRQKAMWYYLGEAKGDLAPPEIEGRSKVIVPVVRNTIESMLPQLMVKFAGSDQVVSFEPNKQGDEEKAEQATDYIAYLYNQKNDGERVTYNALKDSLLSKKGIIKVWWDTTDEVTQEEYRGISDVELSQVMDDEEVKITAQKSYPDEEDAEQRRQALEQLQQQIDAAIAPAQQGNPQAQQGIVQLQQRMQQITSMPGKMLYDITCERTKAGGRLRVENVPPEEFLISRDGKSIAEARFVAHRVPRTLSDLRSMGYKNVDNIGNDEGNSMFNMERIERLSWDDELAYVGQDLPDSSDTSQRTIWVTEVYIRCDYDGTGIAQLRKVVRAGTQILDNEVVDTAPFVDIDCVPMPHKFFGLSIADLAMEGQRIETSLTRGVLDNNAIGVNGRFFAVENQVNLDDLLSSRPGGVVRIKQPGAVGRLEQGMGDMNTAMQMLEYSKGFNEDSTGWTRYNQGSDGDTLNSTATGVNIVTNRADMRLDLIARNMARGFANLFQAMLKLVCQHQQKEDVVRLRGKWVPIDPREWTNGFSITVNVGLGTGNRDQQIRQLMALLSEQKQGGLQMGIATPENVYQAEMELVKALGFKNGDKFWTDPQKNQMPQQPNPEMMKIQAESQAKSAQMQQDLQIKQAELQMKMAADKAEQEYQAQQTALQQQGEMQRAQHEAELKAQLEIERLKIESEIEMQRLQMEQETELKKVALQVAGQIEVARMSTQPADAATAGQEVNMMAQLMQSHQALLETLSRPKQIIRGPDGRAAGIA